MSANHLDDFTLLRYAVEDLDGPERGAAEDHLRACSQCAEALSSVENLDRELRGIAVAAPARDRLDPGDPFAARPQPPPRAPAAQTNGEAGSLAVAALEGSERGSKESGRIIEAAKGSAEEVAGFLSRLDLADLSVRFALLYALQESGRRIAESPPRALALALGSLELVEKDAAGDLSTPAGRILPRQAISAQAHLLAGQARTWSGELESAKTHLEQAYADFGESTGDETSLATVELGESQRRAFSGDPDGAFVLARRCLATFEEMGLEDFVARGRVAVGICLMKLERLEEALETYRSALPVFAKYELWSNYVGAVNSVGATLFLLGRLPEARREYARALKVVSRLQHAAWVGYIRNGLALVLFRAGNYRSAALSFLQTSKLFRETGNIANALTASLYEIECLVLCGETGRAARRFEIFRAEVARHEALDSIIVQQLEAALSGTQPDLEEVAALRESAGQMLRERLG